MSRAYVRLRLTSANNSPEEFFADLGLPAGTIWRKGDRRGETTLIEKEGGYEVRARTPEGMSLNDQIDALLRDVEPVSDKIRKLGCEHVQLTCVVYATEMPAIHFPPSVIEKLSRLGASLDVDLYVAEPNWED